MEKRYLKEIRKIGVNARCSVAAKYIVPLIIKMVNPKSVCDVGCGAGSFLDEFQRLGVEDILGIDGPWIDARVLKIPPSKFIALDLRQDFRFDRKFDIVICLEVAEHLEEQYAENFVKNLTALSDLILFSAAIPFQFGAHHVNEQWPDYWAKLFIKESYTPIDTLRTKLWNIDGIDSYYAQNSVFYARNNLIGNYPNLKNEIPLFEGSPIKLVHPDLWSRRSAVINYIPSFVKKHYGLIVSIFNRVLQNKS